jgi:integrase
MSLLAVSRLLGHASIKTTSDEYAHLAVEDLAAELALLEA